MRRHPKAIVATAFATLLTLALSVSLATATAPTVTIEAASGVGYVSATAKGTVDPTDKDVTACRFDYVNEADFEFGQNNLSDGFAFAQSAPCEIELSELSAGAGAKAVEATLSGMNPATTYHLRLLAENEDGSDEAIAATFETASVPPPVVSIDPVTGLTARGATFSGTVKPNAPLGSPAVFDVNWHFECAPECPGLSGETIPADDATHPVDDDTSGLKPKTEYTVKLIAENAGGSSEARTTFTTAADAPSIDPLAHTSGVTQKAATLRTEVNPNGDATSYRFEWGTDTSYGNVVPAPDKAIGEGTDPVEVSAPIAGLAPDTSYHYRVVAANSIDSVEGPDHEFRTWPVPEEVKPGQYPGQGFLPDNRAWEMVSPPDKNGAEVTLGLGTVRASSSGGAVVFDSNVAFADSRGTGGFGVVTYRADRSSSGWSTHTLMPRQDTNAAALFGFSSGYPWFSPDLKSAVLGTFNPPLTPEASTDMLNLYLTDGNGQNAHLITPSPPQAPSTPFDIQSTPIDVSADLSRVLFESTGALTPDGLSGVRQLYEWHQGTTKLISILPDTACAVPPCVPTEGSTVELPPSGEVNRDRAMSDDGSRVYFTSPPGSDGRIYLRKASQTTLSVSESEATNPDPAPRPANFLDASDDGTRAIFSSGERLLDADLNPSNSQAVEGSSTDLYMYEDSPEPESESNLTLLSADHDPTDGVDSFLNGLVGASADESVVYFAANNRIISGQDPDTEPGGAIYRWQNGSVEYVASVNWPADKLNWFQKINEQSARVSADGRYLLFSTAAPQPGGYDNAGYIEIYLYDAQSQTTICVSCSPAGSPARSDAVLHYPAAAATGSLLYASRSLSADGVRVFFNSADPLVAADTNGRSDAYEWERNGVGSCRQIQGCIYLLSSGKGSGNSFFADASADGSDAYIVTEDPLSGWDKGGGFERDLYVARVDGGLPEPVPAPASCEGDACQPPPAPLNDSTPASAGFSGANQRAKAREHHKRKKHRKARHRGKHRKQTSTRKHG